MAYTLEIIQQFQLQTVMQIQLEVHVLLQMPWTQTSRR